MNELKITFKWENKNAFEMIAKEGEAENVSIVKAEENSCFPLIWNSLEAICQAFITNELKKIGEEMKKE